RQEQDQQTLSTRCPKPSRNAIYHAELILKRSVIPMRRQGTAWDVARAALLLASDDAGFVTGVVLAVDGGSSLGIAPPLPTKAGTES
ncbi:SDR family oxidoreductase, partial [Mycolicibacterium thermoresistibile]